MDVVLHYKGKSSRGRIQLETRAHQLLLLRPPSASSTRLHAALKIDAHLKSSPELGPGRLRPDEASMRMVSEQGRPEGLPVGLQVHRSTCNKSF